MADTKISALTAVATPAGTDEFGVNQGGVSKKETLAQIKTFVNTAPVFAAGSATAGSWPDITSGTLLTTAEVGAWEFDGNCMYMTTDAGNRGLLPVENFIRADATRTFTSNTSQQALFNSPTNGTLTLETGTYLFECLIGMDTMSGTSGNGKFSVLGAGTATLGAVLYLAWGRDALQSATGGAVGGSGQTTATVAGTDTITAATSAEVYILIRGTFEVTGAGTIIPSFAQTTAAAAVLKIGSFFKCNRVGSTTATFVGQWT